MSLLTFSPLIVERKQIHLLFDPWNNFYIKRIEESYKGNKV